MIELKTPKEIEEMKPAGRFVGGILRDLKEFTKVGTNLLEIDEFVHKRIVDRKGAESCYVDYAPDFGTGPFAHYICVSVNDAVLHGVPFDYNLKDGDLVSLDLAINVDGWVADSAISFVVGEQVIIIWVASDSCKITKHGNTASKIYMGKNTGIQNCHTYPFPCIHPFIPFQSSPVGQLTFL